MDTMIMTIVGFVLGGGFVCYLVWRREKSEIVSLNGREAAFCVVALNHYAMTLRLTCKTSELGKPSKEDEPTLKAAGECTAIMHAIRAKLPPPAVEKPRFSILDDEEGEQETLKFPDAKDRQNDNS